MPEPGNRFAALLTLERIARAAPTLDALRLVIVNETHKLLPYAQAALLEGEDDQTLRVTAISNIPGVDRTTPFVQWLERVGGLISNEAQDTAARAVSPEDVPGREAAQWTEFAPTHGMWVRIAAPGRGRRGVLWLAREQPWDEAAQSLLEHLGETFGHALYALAPRARRFDLRQFLRKRNVMGALAAVLIISIIPVRLSALAPAEIVARQPAVVGAPLDGVVKRVVVRPNQQVHPGDVLVVLQDTDVRSRYEIAERALAVAQAEYHRAFQSAFTDTKDRGLLAELSARVDLRKAELDYARAQLEQVTVRADRAGVAVIDDPDAWAGKPVRVGERILEIADPRATNLDIMLAVPDAVVLDAGAPVRLFLDSDPLHPVTARVVRASYRPEVTPEGHLAYRVTARFVNPHNGLRIGLRGTAKIYGHRVVLAYYLLRRPITSLRQLLGW